MPSIKIDDFEYMILKDIAALNKISVENLIQNAISHIVDNRVKTATKERLCQNPRCLNRFSVTRYQKRYCSKACAVRTKCERSKIRRRKEQITKTCSECEKTFRTNHDGVLTCSQVCRRRRANRLEQENYRKHNAPRSPDIQVCIVCDSEFETLNLNKQICSSDCRHKRRKQLEKTTKKS